MTIQTSKMRSNEKSGKPGIRTIPSVRNPDMDSSQMTSTTAIFRSER